MSDSEPRPKPGERSKRPKLARRAPIRAWSTLFAAPAGEQNGAEASAANPAARLNEVVGRSVELGYRVVDEYLRQGQRVARRLSEPGVGPEVIGGDLREHGARLAQLGSEITRIWLESFGLAMPRLAGLGAAAAETTPPAVAPAPAPPPREPARVRIEIRGQAASVCLDLHPGATRRPLLAHDLRAAAESSRLTEVSFEPATDDEPARLRIVVPAGQAPGIYSGLLVDEASNRPVGTLTVEVAAAPPGSAA